MATMNDTLPGKPVSLAVRLGFSLLTLLLLVGAGLMLGSESQLTLRRDSLGIITATNAWRFHGKFTVMTREVRGLRDVQAQTLHRSHSEKRKDYNRGHDPGQELLLIGENQLGYSYIEDQNLILSFIKNTTRQEFSIPHPLDIRLMFASWLCLGLAGLIIVGWIIQILTLGKLDAKMQADLRASQNKKVKPLPAPVAFAVLAVIVGGPWWFFSQGHKVFGPLATSKVQMLMRGAKTNDPALIKQALDKGVYLEARGDQQDTALMLAAKEGSTKAAEALLRSGANASMRSLSDETPLIVAIVRHHWETALVLVDAGVDFAAGDTNGRTALHHAAGAKDVRVLKRMLELKPDVNATDTLGWTPIFNAAASGLEENLRALMAAGADVKRKLPDGRTVSSIAALNPALPEKLRQDIIAAGG